MKRIVFILFLVVAIAAWSTPSFATQNMGASTTLNATGVLEGVTMDATVATLTVGNQDIFTNNRSSEGVATNKLLSAVSSTTDGASTINFTGSSTVYGSISGVFGSEKTFALLTAGASGTTVNFLGRVNATSVSVGTGTVNFKNGASNDGATNFTGDGTIGLAANTTLVGALTSNTDNTGTLSLASGSKLDGAVGAAPKQPLKSINVVGGSSTLPVSGVSATITGEAKTNSFSLLTNTLNIGGALTISTNGVINTTLGSSTVYGNIVVTGASHLGSNLTVRVTVPTTTLLVVGDQFKIVTGAGTDNLATVDPTNSLYTFSIVSTPAGSATIQVLTVPALVPIVNPPVTPIVAIASPVAQVLGGITNPPADLASVIAAINALTDPVAVVNAEAQLAPLTPALVAPAVTFQGAREFQNLWLSRLDMCREVSSPYEDKSNCKGNDARSGWWLKGFGYFGQRNDRGAFPGYDAEIFGTMVAYDVPIGSDTRAGLGIGYARTTINGNTYDTRTSFNTYQGTAYIGHDPGPWFVHGSVSVGWNEYQGMRHIVFTDVDRTANSEYRGQDYTVFAKTGHRFSAPLKFTITPMASLQYSRVNIGSYTESDAGDINLHVKPQGYNFLESGLGAKMERDFSYRGWAIVPEMHLEWLHLLKNPALAETVEFTGAGSAFATPSLKTSPDTFHAGVGITLLSCSCSARRWSLEAGYDYYLRHDGYSANEGTMRATVSF